MTFIVVELCQNMPCWSCDNHVMRPGTARRGSIGNLSRSLSRSPGAYEGGGVFPGSLSWSPGAHGGGGVFLCAVRAWLLGRAVANLTTQ